MQHNHYAWTAFHLHLALLPEIFYQTHGLENQRMAARQPISVQQQVWSLRSSASQGRMLERRGLSFNTPYQRRTAFSQMPERWLLQSFVQFPPVILPVAECYKDFASFMDAIARVGQMLPGNLSIGLVANPSNPCTVWLAIVVRFGKNETQSAEMFAAAVGAWSALTSLQRRIGKLISGD